MRGLARLRSLWRGLSDRARMEADLDEELAGYVDEMVARKRQAGMPAEAARRAVLAEMGSLPHVRQAVRGSWVVSAWDAAAQDVRQAWRGLRRTPAASAVAIATFALGIGAVTAIVGVVNATLFTPPPYGDPGRLVFVWRDMTAAGYPRAPLSGPELDDLARRTTSFEGFGAVWASSLTLTEGEPEFVRVGRVSQGFFPLLGVEAAAGRILAPEDEAQGPPRAVLLSWPLWQRRFGGDPALVGRTILLDGNPATVVGVLPPQFRLLLPPGSGTPDDLEAYVLFDSRYLAGPRGQQYLRVVGRMKPGVSLDQARHDIARVAAQAGREFPEYGAKGLRFETVGLQAENTREVRAPLWIVTAGVAVLLMISAVNVLAVLVARAAARRREIAVRVALGAGLRRILRLSLAEGLTLAALGAALGLALGRGGLSALLAARPDALRRVGEVAMDGRVLALTAGLVVLWGVLFALAPLREHARSDLHALLGSTRGEGPRLRVQARSALVMAQVALTVVLLVGAGLLARTFANILSIDPGFRAGGVLTFRVPSATPRYTSPESRMELARRMRAALGALPGVTSAGAVSHLPYDSIPNWGGPYSAHEPVAGEALPLADYRSVSPGFFETTGVELQSGRFFAETDGPRAQAVAIVDDLLARRAWPGEAAEGRRLFVDPFSRGAPTTWVTVVGVVRHVRQRSLVEPMSEQVYFPLAQSFRNPVAYAVRTTKDPATLASAARLAVKSVDPALPIFEAQPLASYVERARALQRFTMTVVAVFAAAALLLASVGVYGVMAYVVVQRRREYGVRMALGASRGQILGLVLREGARLTAIGGMAGVAASLAAGGFISSQLFGVAPLDALTYAVAVPVLAGAALVACWWPARRATRVDVLELLRAE